MSFNIIANIEKQILQLKQLKTSAHDLLKANNIDVLSNEKSEQSEFMLKAKNLKELKVAAIMDEFTLNSYKPECNLIELTPSNWHSELTSFKPDVIFIESAWEGKEKLWYKKISNCSSEIFSMANYANEQNIPIVFWNKEDPVYTDTFMATARLADIVFTTDIDCIQKYKTVLGHDNVYHLHFAAQPKYHNPIEKFDRKDKFCFAGAYYHRYPVRAKTFDEFAKVFIETKGFDIYDRNYQNALPEHKFPDIYNGNILGKLPASEIDVAYKGYNYGINMNSVNQSQTMFARRVFELLASNTITVGNYSRGVKNYFGDLTICTDDEKTLKNCLDTYCTDEKNVHKYRLLGLRKTLSNHLYEDRLDYVVSKVFGQSIKCKLPTITVVGIADTKQQANYIKEKFDSQNYENKKLIVVSDNTDIDDISVMPKSKISDIYTIATEGFVSLFDSSDYYGKNFLLDLALTLRYKEFSGIGKASYYSNNETELIINNNDNLYKHVNELNPSRAIISVQIINDIEKYLANKPISCENFFSVDEFNYASNINCDYCSVVDDITIHDSGISLKQINQITYEIEAEINFDDNLKIPAEEIASIRIPLGTAVTLTRQSNDINIVSQLDDNVHTYLYSDKLYEFANYNKDGKLPISFFGVGDLDLICVIVFYDENKKKLSPAYPKLNRAEMIDIPKHSKYIKIGFRPKGKGITVIKNIIIGESFDNNDKQALTRSNTLVLTNIYPSKEAIYRNMFVHQRVKAYKNDGHVFDVMCMNIYAKDGYREYDGINVIEGQSQALYSVLENGQIDTVCVHFLDKQMWSVLKQFADRIRILVWFHGAEIQPWWRREYNFTNEKDLEIGKKASAERMNFWHEFFDNTKNCNIHFIFVSQYFADEVIEDYKLNLTKDQYSIVHNCIDTDLFTFNKKSQDQRLKLVSIRPYANNKYANDLTIKAIKYLENKNYFNDLNFFIAGSGDMFDEVTAPLKKLKNVTLKNSFFTHNEIVELYQSSGIVLTPTRMDAQGVSRDEAMSCGCVPITNAVAAIPEFVDENCGILAESENFEQMAQGIEFLYNNPDKFIAMSENAAKRVRSQTSKEYTIDKELSLILDKN